MKNHYIVDYENVKAAGLDGVSKLTADDTVHIFYSENADTLTFGLHKRLNEADAVISYQKVEVGQKNALDFQLASFLGYLIRENEDVDAAYYIITKDKGFAPLETYWKKRKKNVSLAVDVAGQSEKARKEELKKKVELLVGDKKDAETVTNIIEQYKTKQGINNALMKQFSSKGDNKRGGEIYKLIKPLIADKKGN